MIKELTRRFYDSHPDLPLDPDSDQRAPTRQIHTHPAHIAVVAAGAFFGTLVRYEIGLCLPNTKDGWPVATLLINVVGAFLLGLLLQALLRCGNDEGGRRLLRLTLGTGFLGAFTTYSSLATGIVELANNSSTITAALLYAVASIGLGAGAAALGIRAATTRHARRKGAV